MIEGLDPTPLALGSVVAAGTSAVASASEASMIDWLSDVYDEHASSVFTLAMRITGDVPRAELAVEQAFAAFIETASIRDMAVAGPLLRGLVVRAARDMLRSMVVALVPDLLAGATDASARDEGDDPLLPAGLRVVPFPRADTAFAAHLDHALSATELHLRSVERELRAAYPAARLVMGLALSNLIPGDVRLYAYRDGSLMATRDVLDPYDLDQWWRDVSLPRTVLSADHRYVDANEAASALFGVRHDGIIGVPAGTFTRHETDPAIGARLFELLDRTGAITSTAFVVRPDGTELAIDFHTELDGPRHVTTMRERAAS
jgi:PAS domain-containing protein